MILKDVLYDNCFYTTLNATEKKGIITEIAEAFHKSYGLDQQKTFEALWNREEKGSTGLGKGLAIPHARIPNIGTMKVVVIYVAEGRNFDAYDNIPSKLFFSAIIDEDSQPQDQLEILKTIVETCENTDLMEALQNVHTPDQLKDIISRRVTEIQNN